MLTLFEMDFQKLRASIRGKEFKPVYLLHGEEPYFIDVLCSEIRNHAIDEDFKDFNETIVYGKDVSSGSIISFLKEYPMMYERRLVIVREAQDLKDIEDLCHYFDELTDSSILVLAYKYKKLDSRKKLFKSCSKIGVVFLSEKLRDYQLKDWILAIVKSSDFAITPKAAALLAEFLGNDLSRIKNELDKLSILLEKGSTINEIHIEENIGVSKDYNVFELCNAVSENDFIKSMKIIRYFELNPKSGPLVVVISSLFNLFIQFMKIHFSPNKTAVYLAKELKIHAFFVEKLVSNSKNFPPKKAASNISILYEYDLKSKGINNNSFSESHLMVELIVKLLS